MFPVPRLNFQLCNKREQNKNKKNLPPEYVIKGTKSMMVAAK